MTKDKSIKIHNKQIVRTVCSIMALLVVSLCMLAPRLFPQSSDTGADQAQVLHEIGVLTAHDGVYLAQTAVPEAVTQAALRLFGSGDAADAPAFYRYLALEQAPEFTFPKEQETVTETACYALLLGGLGYSDAGNVLETAKTAGFGFMREVRDSGTPLTNGTFALLLYETLFLRPETADYPVYRILANLNSEFGQALLDNGLYDDIPESYVPLFNDGIYQADSYAKLPGTDGRCEWTATYMATTETYVAEYIQRLLTGGWTREGTYVVEHETLPATIELFYRANPENPAQELAVVLKCFDNGLVEWALFRN